MKSRNTENRDFEMTEILKVYFHFLFPFVITALTAIHLLFLHQTGLKLIRTALEIILMSPCQMIQTVVRTTSAI
jgi:hypothetical protein